MAIIFPNKIQIDKEFIIEKNGLLNALTYSSAQYLYKVIEKHDIKNLKRYDQIKIRHLKRTIIHKNSHLDEYFAELFFRAILPPQLKDIDVFAHVLMSKEADTLARLSWPEGVVFGISPNESMGVKALDFFDEHNEDGTKCNSSCSDLVVKTFLGENIPTSIKIVLNEVNISDSSKGSHELNMKNIISLMHDVLFVVGKNQNDDSYITKYLTEPWKRSIIDACITAMVYLYENKLLPIDDLSDDHMIKIERIASSSLNEFIQHTLLKNNFSHSFNHVKNVIENRFRIGNHTTIQSAKWKDSSGNVKGQQVFIVHILCFALHKCWGEEIAQIIMSHIWQVLFQKDIIFHETKNEINNLYKKLSHEELVSTSFGNIQLKTINNPYIKPEVRENDSRKRSFSEGQKLHCYYVEVNNPKFFNIDKVIKNIINERDNGFAVFLLHDSTLNSNLINTGPTLPYELWALLCESIYKEEPDRWYFLKQKDGNFADFALNRTKSHMDSLPSEKINLDFIIQTLQNSKRSN